VLVPPEDASELARAILALREDQEERARLGESGRLYVERRLSSRRVLDTFEAWLREWSAAPRGGSVATQNSRA
jgi:glycosyltransferase involved in cell wall biosynthesis